MAFLSGTVTGVVSLMSTLSTFAQAQAWNEDHVDTDRLFLSKGNAFISFRWAAATPVNVAIYQSLGFINSSTDPGNHTSDSGQGVVTGVEATLATGRHVPLSVGSMTYWFFEDAGYIHVVVRVATNDYRHFGFGLITRFGDDWTGGEYAYGHRWNAGSGDFDLLAVRQDSNMLLDALGNEVAFAATIHVEGIPNQVASSAWGVIGDIATPGNDRGATGRNLVFGGFRGLIHRQFPWQSNNDAGLVPMASIPVLINTNSGADVFLLGYMTDVRAVDITAFAAEQVVNIGGDDWQFFPAKSKGVWDGVTQTTTSQGIAYKRVP